jgi:hypothetical protein
MNFNMTLSQQTEFAMPVFGSVLVAAMRALPTGQPTGTAPASATDMKRPFVDTTPVCGYRHITDVAVLDGTFPGTSAWSPPI